MSKISRVTRKTAVAVFGSIWLVDDIAGRICEHLGRRAPSLHFGEAFATLEEAQAARPGSMTVQPLPEHILLPTVTPVPKRHDGDSESVQPREVFLVEFDNLLATGLRVTRYNIDGVEFEVAPPHLTGKVDFVARSILTGIGERYRIMVEYDGELRLNIVENPRERQGEAYVASSQSMAFFGEAEAAEEADRFAASLVAAADWRSRSYVAVTASETTEAA
jgi:hypothetical protein